MTISIGLFCFSILFAGSFGLAIGLIINRGDACGALELARLEREQKHRAINELHAARMELELARSETEARR